MLSRIWTILNGYIMQCDGLIISRHAPTKIATYRRLFRRGATVITRIKRARTREVPQRFSIPMLN